MTDLVSFNNMQIYYPELGTDTDITIYHYVHKYFDLLIE